MKSWNIIFITLALLLTGCDNFLNSNHQGENYPVIFERLTDGEQEQLTEDFKNNNDFEFPCASVNEYGFNDSKICLDRDILRVEIKDEEEERMQNLAADFLERNKEFTNVEDRAQLEIVQSHGMPGCVKCDGTDENNSTIGWRIVYNNQNYQGLEVENSRITIFLDSEKVYAVNGHWYRDIIIPPIDQIDHDDARELLAGKELTYHDWTGEKTYTITEDSFNEFEDKAIFPFETERGLELRVSLIVEAGIWHFYLDSTTGELVHTKPLILF